MLDLAFEPHEVRLVVSDDGLGFHPPQPLDRLARDEHFGLLGMQERVQQLNGTLQVSSKPGNGTTIRAALPLENGDQPSQSVRDPVCGAVIQPQQAYGSTLYKDERYYFCCPVCQGAFQQHRNLCVCQRSSCSVGCQLLWVTPQLLSAALLVSISVRLPTHLSTPPALLKPQAASPTVLPLACAASLMAKPCRPAGSGRASPACSTRCVSRTFTNAQRVIDHTDAWCEAAFARKGAL